MYIDKKLYYPNQFEHKEISLIVGLKRLVYFTNGKGEEILQINYPDSVKVIKLHKGQDVPKKYAEQLKFLKEQHVETEWIATSQVKIN